jgi:hypothetical protein
MHLETVPSKCNAYLYIARSFLIMFIPIQKVVDICLKDILVDWHLALGFGIIQVMQSICLSIIC